MRMTREEAKIILECMATDMIGAMAGMRETMPMLDVLRQRVDAINIALTALSTLQAENAKLKKERDAACEYCAKLHSKEPCREEDGSCKPKWRGRQEGDEGDR